MKRNGDVNVDLEFQIYNQNCEIKLSNQKNKTFLEILSEIKY